jgi:hypothetical protein
VKICLALRKPSRCHALGTTQVLWLNSIMHKKETVPGIEPAPPDSKASVIYPVHYCTLHNAIKEYTILYVIDSKFTLNYYHIMAAKR